MTESAELYKRYRPKTLAEIVGQPDAVRIIESWGPRIPHSILLTGPSGCGKTSVARILRSMIGCHRDDFNEKNCADFKGIDTAREIRRYWMKAPLRKSIAWLLDEVHKTTGDFQSAMLKILEDTPEHVYFFLATTDPQKLLPTIRNRCSVVTLKSVAEKDMQALIRRVAGNEKFNPSDAVVESVIEAAAGSPRAALVLLNSVIGIADPKQQLAAIQKADTKSEAYQIFKLLISPRTRWADMAALLKTVDLEEPEGVRRLLLACACTALLGNGGARAAAIIDYMQKPFFDSGKPGFIWAISEILRIK